MRRIVYRRISSLFLAGFIAVVSFAGSVKGRVCDVMNCALPYVTVRLLRPDSTFVSGTVTDSLGVYVVNSVTDGNYLLAFSSIGYTSQVIPVSLHADSAFVASV